jgi:anti-anti-sigma regulatory factor
MRSEALDIVIESRGSAVWLTLAGPFHNEQVPNIREKITGFIADGNRQITIDLEQVIEIGDAVVPMFIGLLNLIRGKDGDLRFIFKNPVVTAAFASVRNIFQIFPDANTSHRSTFFGALRYRRLLMSRRTGIRLSRPVALFTLFALLGWFVSLAIIIWMQSERIRTQAQELHDLSQWNKQAEIELKDMNERLRPMEQLGLLRDVAPAPLPVPAPKPAAPKKSDTTASAARQKSPAATDSATAAK